ncbi:Capsule polysaccharide biosynthesis, partial [mine drainage metagenome]
DVVARMRLSGQDEARCREWCDAVVTTEALPSLLEAVDEVHVLSSLAGFEALLRGKTVVCYGQPFYAGWGLTRDIRPVTRRQRRLSLEELVVGALLCYPLYLSRDGQRRLTPEEALDALVDWRAREGGAGTLVVGVLPHRGTDLCRGTLIVGGGSGKDGLK